MNLLPSAEQRVVRQEQWRRVIVALAVASCAALVIGAVFLSPSLLSLTLERKELERSLAIATAVSQNRQVGDVLVRMREVANSVARLERAKKEPPYIAQTLAALLDTGKGDIVLTHLGIREDGAIAIDGVARTRQALLRFEETLRDSALLSGVLFPLSGVIRQNDITFSAQARLKNAPSPDARDQKNQGGEVPQ